VVLVLEAEVAALEVETGGAFDVGGGGHLADVPVAAGLGFGVLRAEGAHAGREWPQKMMA